jgi:KDO2-lipid IV(A) lauroyltransferase
MKRKRPLWADYAVYLAIRALVTTLQALPIRLTFAVADQLARLLYTVDKRHRAVAMENLRLAFGDTYDDAGRDRIVRGVYRHFCRMLVEMLHSPRLMKLTTWRQRVTLSNHAPSIEILLDGKPAILLTGHFGNWEMAGYLFGVYGFATHAIARKLDNPYLDRYLRTFREGTGQTLIDKNTGYDEMLAVMKSGGALSFIGDQDAGPRGLFVDFFGRPASTHKSIALLAIEYDAPILVGGAYRVGDDFQYVVRTEAVIRPSDYADQPDAVKRITQDFTAALERLIRQAPEQYLWLHRRWKHQPKPKAAKGLHAAPRGDEKAPLTSP